MNFTSSLQNVRSLSIVHLVQSFFFEVLWFLQHKINLMLTLKKLQVSKFNEFGKNDIGNFEPSDSSS